MTQTKTRKKMNFMINEELIIKLDQAIPAGKRSDFINQALDRALLIKGQEKAINNMDKLRKKLSLKISKEELKTLKNYGRQ